MIEKKVVSKKHGGFVITVSDEDAGLLDYRWSVGVWKRGGRPWIYVERREVDSNGKPQTIRLHTAVLGHRPGMMIDHIDGNPLNNCRDNLRHVTVAENAFNRGLNVNNTVGYKGVVRRGKDKFYARLSARKKHYYGPIRNSAEAASDDYNRLSRQHHGEYGRLNPTEKGGRR